LSDENTKEKEIFLHDILPGEEGSITNIYLSQIVTARYEEILYFVGQELKKI
jgi:cell division ATPase FtsA